MRLFRRIRVQLATIVLICYLLPVFLLGFCVGGKILKGFEAKTGSALVTGMDYSLMLTEENLQRAEDLSKDATYDGELSTAVAQRDSGSIPEGEFLRLGRSYIERKYSREPLLTFAACFTLDHPDRLLFSRNGGEAASRYQEKAHEAVRVLGESLDNRCSFIGGDGDLYLVRNLMNLRMKTYGMLMLGVDVHRLVEPLAALAREWDVRLDLRLDGVALDDLTGTGASGPEADVWDKLPEARITVASAGQYAVVRRGKGRDYALRVGLTLGRARPYGELDAFRMLLNGLLLLLIPILAVLEWYVYRRITRPIALLSEAANRIEGGELGVTVPMCGDDELGRLGRAFSSMSLRLQELIEKTYKEEIALRDARVQAMQSRINPHFINNALETVNWQARMEGSATISAMVESLSVLLNAGMSRNDRRMIPLREELETARAYFYFIGLRFGDRLETRMDIAPEALEDVLPALTLQPILENAVEHGIAPANGGRISLRCAHEGGFLRLEVVNSGKGISAQDKDPCRNYSYIMLV